MENYFAILNNIDCSTKIEQKNGLSYLSWAWAWAEIKKIHPKANFKIYETETGVNYWTDGRTGWVKTGVTIDDIEHIEYLPIMDFKNRSIPLENITSVDVNKAIQRSLTKACARHGLGLYIYAGEDLPEAVKQERKQNDLPEAVKKESKQNDLLIEKLIESINLCKTTDELSKIWDNNARMQTEVKFKQAVILRKKQLEDELIEAINICKTTDELSKIWADNVSLQKDAKFKQAVILRKKQIENGNK